MRNRNDNPKITVGVVTWVLVCLWLGGDRREGHSTVTGACDDWAPHSTLRASLPPPPTQGRHGATPTSTPTPYLNQLLPFVTADPPITLLLLSK